VSLVALVRSFAVRMGTIPLSTFCRLSQGCSSQKPELFGGRAVEKPPQETAESGPPPTLFEKHGAKGRGTRRENFTPIRYRSYIKFDGVTSP
jgi:hypothetical protein